MLIENNVIQSDHGLENTFPAPGIVFYGGDPDGNVIGFQTIVKNNIIIDNVTYGIDNPLPTVHAFASNYNCIHGNISGNYNNVSSTTDIYSNPELESTLLDVYNNILNTNWQNAVLSGNFEGDLGANEAKLTYHLKSEFGRWNGMQWVTDTATSPCIDAGDTTSDYTNEPMPNGNTINLGAFGNSTFASKSPNSLLVNDYFNTKMSVFPNPTSDKISIPKEFITHKFSIYSLTGKIIKNGVVKQNEIRISELKRGIYILKINDSKSNTQLRLFKIIKE